MRVNDEIGGAGGPGAMACRIIIADALPLVGTALAALVTAAGYAVTAIAHDHAGVDAAIATNCCDLMLIDIELFDPGQAFAAPVIVTAPASNHPGLAVAVARGIDGLVVKTESADLLALCLGRVAGGGQWFDRNALADVAVQVEAHKDAGLLTPRERDVARLVAAGQRNRTIAVSLGISEGTVKMHLHNVYTKLGLESRTQLAMDERLRNPAGSVPRASLSGGIGALTRGGGRQPREELVA